MLCYYSNAIRIEMKITFVQMLIGINGFAVGYEWYTSLFARQFHAIVYFCYLVIKVICMYVYTYVCM